MKTETVTNMTIGQLYDAVQEGGEFYYFDKSLAIDSFGPLKVVGEKGQTTMHGIRKALMAGKIRRAIKPSWTEKLDGTTENGVWCKCKDREGFGSIQCIIRAMGGYFLSANGVSVFISAEPLTQDQVNALNLE